MLFSVAALTLCFQLLDAEAVTLCEYLHAIGRSAPECDTSPVVLQSTDGDIVTNEPMQPEVQYSPAATPTTTTSPLALIISNIEHRDKMRKADRQSVLRPWLPTCNGANGYKDCKVDNVCRSGFSCLSGHVVTRCCLHHTGNRLNVQRESCPSPTDLGYICLSKKHRTPTNWCNHDADCANRPVKKCCDTGCGFNVCMQPDGHIFDTGNALRFVLPAQCPPPAAMHITCRRSKFRSTSWCESDESCQVLVSEFQRSPNRVARFCCPTSCGYNACVGKFGDEFILG